MVIGKAPFFFFFFFSNYERKRETNRNTSGTEVLTDFSLLHYPPHEYRRARVPWK